VNILTDTGERLAGLTVSGYFHDDFERGPADTVVALGNGWTDFAYAFPEDYDPCGILNGKVVVADVTRSAISGLPWAPDPGLPPHSYADYLEHPGTIIPGIGGAWRDMGTPHVRCSVVWSGDWDYPYHAEGTPIVCINPDSGAFGWGAWPSAYTGEDFEFDVPAFLIGSIGKPPEDFAVVDAKDFAHTSGTPRTIELRTNTLGTTCTLWLDGVQQSTVQNGLNPIPIDPELHGSTLHGFEHDQHVAAYVDGAPSTATYWQTSSITEITITAGS
jgi:hypothetical protein